MRLQQDLHMLPKHLILALYLKTCARWLHLVRSHSGEQQGTVKGHAIFVLAGQMLYLPAGWFHEVTSYA